VAVHVAWSIRAVDVITVVEAAMERYGVPEHIRRQRTGVHSLRHRGLAQGQRSKNPLHHSRQPMGERPIESFHDKLRDEFLNREISAAF